MSLLKLRVMEQDGGCSTRHGRLSWFDAALIAVSRPRVLSYRLSLLLEGPHFRRQRISWLGGVTALPESQVRKYVSEIEMDKEFLRAVRTSLQQNALYFPLPTDFTVAANGSTIFFHCVSLYAFLRLIQPRVVVETGGTPGKSSAFILRALQRNGRGHLYTVDSPPPESDHPLGVHEVYSKRPRRVGSNWCVPDWLRGRQTLLLETSQTCLPVLLRQLGEVCLFIHDSDHSYSHMRWELESALPFVREAGFLWSDDIGTNAAWSDFCEEHRLMRNDFTSQGVAKKVVSQTKVRRE